MRFDNHLSHLGEKDQSARISRLRDTIYDVLLEDAKAHKELPLTEEKVTEFLSTPVPELMKNVVRRAQAEVAIADKVKEHTDSVGKKLMYSSAYTVGKRLGLTPKSLTETEYHKRSDDYKDKLLKKIFEHNFNK